MVTRIILNETSYHGAGAVKSIVAELAARGLKKPIVFSDPDLVKFGVTKKVTDILDKAQIKYELFTEIQPNPTIENVKSGVKAAKKANKKIFVLNAGSDWDPGSVTLRKSVLDPRDFQQVAKRSLILLYLDSPQKFPQPEEQIRHHDIIREKLQLKGKKVPTAVIIDADGKILCEISGVLPKNEYLDKIRAAIADDTTGK